MKIIKSIINSYIYVFLFGLILGFIFHDEISVFLKHFGININ